MKTIGIGKVLYGIFVAVQFSLALYYSNEAIKSWTEAPVVVSGIRLDCTL